MAGPPKKCDAAFYKRLIKTLEEQRMDAEKDIEDVKSSAHVRELALHFLKSTQSEIEELVRDRIKAEKEEEAEPKRRVATPSYAVCVAVEATGPKGKRPKCAPPLEEACPEVSEEIRALCE